MSIVERMFTIMDSKKIKMTDLANKIGVNKSVISTWKSRKTNPPVEYMDRICELLGVSYEFFLKGVETPVQNNFHLTQDEEELLRNYNKLDSRGQHKLHTVVYEELDRVEEEKTRAGTSWVG